MAGRSKNNKTRGPKNARRVRSMARRIETIVSNTVKPTSGYIPRMRGIPTSPMHMIRNRIEIILVSESAEALVSQIDEKDDFDGKFRVGTKWAAITENRYFVAYVGMNALAQFAISKLHRINYTNPTNQDLLPYQRGLVALKKMTLILPVPKPNGLIPLEGVLAYKFSDSVAPNSAHTEATESGTGKLPFARIQVPQMDWVRLGNWTALTYKPTIKINIELDRILKNVKTDAPTETVIGYLDTTIAYKFDDVYFAPDTETVKKYTPKTFPNGTEFSSYFQGLNLALG